MVSLRRHWWLILLLVVALLVVAYNTSGIRLGGLLIGGVDTPYDGDNLA